MNPIKFEMSKIHEHAKTMPSGYVRDLVHHGRMSDDRKTIEFDRKSYKMLLQKYQARPHGAGRFVATMTSATGIAATVKGLVKGCGCRARENRINRIGKKLTKILGA